MRKALILATALFATVGLASEAQAKGCIKGAIVGGAAGSVVKHGKAGAVVGCIAGHHRAKVKSRVK